MSKFLDKLRNSVLHKIIRNDKVIMNFVIPTLMVLFIVNTTSRVLTIICGIVFFISIIPLFYSILEVLDEEPLT